MYWVMLRSTVTVVQKMPFDRIWARAFAVTRPPTCGKLCLKNWPPAGSWECCNTRSDDP